ncbi:GtrA family protein [Sphingopyxis sp.]|jgi:putative flippase GtrA|uniref:GtrA family protein n=1 Tax=Sphingopyxis sp. TaxID=1908224 RepID=UPI003F70B4CE
MTASPAPDATEPFRYLVVGGFCAVLNSVILIGGDALGVHYIASNIAAFAIVSTLAFILHARRTFAVAMNWARYWRFMTGLISAFVISTALYALIYDALNVPMVIASPLITGLIMAYNYLAARFAMVGKGPLSRAGR